MENPFEIINERLDNIEKLLQEMLSAKSESQPIIEEPIDIRGTKEITGLSKNTIYLKAQRNEIPYHKKGNRLYFFKSELIEWIKQGKQKAN